MLGWGKGDPGDTLPSAFSDFLVFRDANPLTAQIGMIIVSSVSRENRPSAAAERGPLDETTSARATAIRRVGSLELLGPKGELIIEHDGREYRLRLTQNGKLILTA